MLLRPPKNSIVENRPLMYIYNMENKNGCLESNFRIDFKFIQAGFICLIFSVINICALYAQKVEVQFQVNMNHQIGLNNFDPGTDQVEIAGSFNGWGANPIVLEDKNNDGVYTGKASLSLGLSIEFKTRINGEWDDRSEFAGGANREYKVDREGVIHFWYNDHLPDHVLDPRIASSITLARPGELVKFFDQSNGEPVEWSWTFAGGKPETSTQKNPLVSFDKEGVYSVTLSIKNSKEETASKSFTNYVKVDSMQTYWWNDAVFYQIFPRSFKDSDGDGIGDLKGIIEKLDYLNDGDPGTHHDLGVTAIWLTPFMESPSYHGYDIVDYRKVGKEYGSSQDFKELIKEAHKRGIKVIVDFVPNHTSHKNPWFVEALDPASEKRDWYIWRDTVPDLEGPWGQKIWHKKNGSYHYGVFWQGMPDLNYHNPEVKKEMFDIARFWLEDMNVDGLRLDAIKFIFETEESIEDNEETFQFMKDFRTFYKSVKKDAFAVGEAWTSTDMAKNYVNDGGIDYCFEFELAYAILEGVKNNKVKELEYRIEKVMRAYPYLQFGAFLSNHDIDRVMDILEMNEQKAKLAAQVQLALPGVPYIYYGEELAMTGSKPDENMRTPMQWDNSPGAGFTKGKPWNKENQDYHYRNVKNFQQDYSSIWHTYQKAVALRNNQVALRRGNYRSVEVSSYSVFAFLRQYGDENILVVANLGDKDLNDIYLTLHYGGIKEGSYQMVELQGRGQMPLHINENGGFSKISVGPIPAKTLLMYKLMDSTALLTNVTFSLDANQLPRIKKNAVMEVECHWEGGADKQIFSLSEDNSDGIYVFTLPNIPVGTRIQYGYSIKKGKNVIARNPYQKEYIVLEGDNYVKETLRSGKK
jgi:alpha-amylase